MRRLIVCNDGTWNSPDDEDRGKVKPTNVTKISRAIKPVDNNDVSQIVFYREGVGTGFGEKLLGGITGFGLSKNIIESYQFLAHNFQDGDEVFLFGFSRGAYTSRSLVGLINRVGLLLKDDVFYLPKLFEFYREGKSAAEIEAFYQEKSLLRHNTRIKMIGVFDTVGALGIPFGGINNVLSGLDLVEMQFHDVSLAPIIDHAYHALAIDEHRVPFAPTLWEKPSGSNATLEQRWFSGVHSNIGGGYNPDDLANLALQYMVSKAKGCGLEFDDHYLSFYGGDVDQPTRDSMTFKYRLLGENVREISLADDTNQVVDDSVYQKIAQDSNYQPVNVPKPNPH
jgi:uncharacterized protein (DUF2235 family)